MGEQDASPEKVRQLHVHSVRSMSWASGVPVRSVDLASYAERSLLMATAGDLVCLHESPDPAYLAYLNRLGIGPRISDVVCCPDPNDTQTPPLSSKLLSNRDAWEQLLERLHGADEVMLQPYMATRYERELVRRLQERLQTSVRLLGGESHVIERFDQKHHVRELALKIGVSVAPGEVTKVSSASDWFHLARAIRRHLNHTGTVIVRGASGNGGSSVQVVAGRRYRALHRPSPTDRCEPCLPC